MNNTIIENKESNKVIFLLSGRGQSSSNFLGIYEPYFKNFNLVAIQPESEWYPIPNGIDDQLDSVNILKQNIPALFKEIKKIRKSLNIFKKDTIIAGFSAGGVMALELASYNDKRFHSVICHNGAILNINKFPIAKNKTQIVLIHSKDDNCFFWDERYIPMKKCLIEKKYCLNIIERETGGHNIYPEDINRVLKLVS